MHAWDQYDVGSSACTCEDLCAHPATHMVPRRHGHSLPLRLEDLGAGATALVLPRSPKPSPPQAGSRKGSGSSKAGPSSSAISGTAADPADRPDEDLVRRGMQPTFMCAWRPHWPGRPGPLNACAIWKHGQRDLGKRACALHVRRTRCMGGRAGLRLHARAALWAVLMQP